MYAIQPGRRFALDLDGTVGLIQFSGGAMQQLSAKAMRNIQNRNTWSISMDSTGVPVPEDPARYTPTSLWLIFPEPRDLYAVYMVYGWRANFSGSFSWGTYDSGYVYSSADTTTGLDGSWDAIGEFVGTNGYIYSNSEPTMAVGTDAEDVIYANTISTNKFPRGYAVDSYRRYAVPLAGAVSSVRGLRFDLSNRGYGYPASVFGDSAADQDYFIQNLHLYGTYSENAASDSLVFWHPTSDSPLEMPDLDMRDTAVGTTSVKKFRLKNVSSTLSAQDVVLSKFTDIDTTPSILTQYYLSIDGTTWLDSISIGTLAPGAVSSALWVSRNTPVNAQMSANVLGIKATVGSWA